MESPISGELLHSIAEFRKKKDQHELEIRVGTYVASKFHPGVTKEVFEQLERDLTDAPSLSTDNRWVELLDYHFVSRESEPARTRASFTIPKV